ncbi:MAG TPA: ISKra4 family transposase [Streptosporangiaceae bacterium]|nr:ISKra4 family transposase [Streptosporangiaceae bacterium]
MEEYGLDELAASAEPVLGGLDELAASAEAVLAGLGPLAAGFARLAVQAGRAVTLQEMEGRVAGEGRKLLCGLIQLGLDAQAAGEVRVAQVTGTDGVPRRRAERGHARTVVTRLGAVVVRRISYRSGVKGVPSLFPRDAVLNLPLCGYSWDLQRLAGMFCQSGSYEQGHEFVLAATGVSIGKRQLEQIIIAAAADAERFYQDRLQDQQDPDPDLGPGQDPGQGPGPGPLALSGDGKGVAMLPEARRGRAKDPEQRVRTFEKRAGTGEKKGCKRMAETGAVFDVVPEPRTPEQVMRPDPGTGTKPARAQNRWYACDITAGRDVTIGKVFDEAGRRDPDHARTWIALVDGDNHQLGLFQAQAAARGITLAIVIDFIHVLEYLWKAAWCFHAPRDPAMEDWVIAQALDILHGRAAEVIDRIARLAADHPPRPGSEHAKIIRKTLSYLQNKQAFMDYPRALAEGWPIATGVIEGACRHLVADRMGITGARWSLPGAQAMLWLRAINASGDTSAYWNYHIQQERQRNHLSRYQDTLELAA